MVLPYLILFLVEAVRFVDSRAFDFVIFRFGLYVALLFDFLDADAPAIRDFVCFAFRLP